MRRLVRAIRRLILRSHDRTAREADACHLSQMEVHQCDKFTGKPQHYSPEKGWRLLDRISCTIHTTNRDDTHDIELDEDILERIDFLACLFGPGKIE